MPKINLLKETQSKQGTTDIDTRIREIDLSQIQVDSNVRQDDQKGITELIESIEQVGLLQPITVYEKIEGGFGILTGHRRYQAFLKLYDKRPKDKSNNQKLQDENAYEKYHKIPCIVSGADNLKIKQLIENVQRENLSGWEVAQSLKEFKEQGYDYDQIGKLIGKSGSYIEICFSAIRKLEQEPEIAETAKSFAGVTLTDINDTSAIKDIKTRKNLLEKKGKKEITRAEMRKEVKKIKNTSKPTNSKPKKYYIKIEVEEKTYSTFNKNKNALTQKIIEIIRATND